MASKSVAGIIENTNTSYSLEDKSIEGIIADLRVVIDQIGNSQSNARHLILELARRLEEGNTYEQDQICIRIKEILRDKIKEHKVTERWIEKCLPAKYKGKHTKTELSSLSRRNKRNPTEEALSIQQDKEALYSENCELKEALKRQTAFIGADQISANEITYIVRAEKFNQITEAMEISMDFIRLVFDKSGLLERVESDLF
jgi:hypothetical protein